MTDGWQEWQDRAWELSTPPRTTRLFCEFVLLYTPREKTKTKTRNQHNSKAQDSPAAGPPQLNSKHEPSERKTQGDGGAVGTGRPVLSRPVPPGKAGGRDAGGGV